MIIPRLSPVIYYGIVSCHIICEFNLTLNLPKALRNDDDVRVFPAGGYKRPSISSFGAHDPTVHISKTKGGYTRATSCRQLVESNLLPVATFEQLLVNMLPATC